MKLVQYSIRVLNPQSARQIPEPEAYMEKPPDAEELGRLIAKLLPGEN